MNQSEKNVKYISCNNSYMVEVDIQYNNCKPSYHGIYWKRHLLQSWMCVCVCVCVFVLVYCVLLCNVHYLLFTVHFYCFPCAFCVLALWRRPLKAHLGTKCWQLASGYKLSVSRSVPEMLSCIVPIMFYQKKKKRKKIQIQMNDRMTHKEKKKTLNNTLIPFCFTVHLFAVAVLWSRRIPLTSITFVLFFSIVSQCAVCCEVLLRKIINLTSPRSSKHVLLWGIYIFASLYSRLVLSTSQDNDSMVINTLLYGYNTYMGEWNMSYPIPPPKQQQKKRITWLQMSM